MQSPALRLNTTQWLICIIASIGFAFDIYELLMLPLIVGPAMLELIGAQPGSNEFQMWVSRLFYWPAICGGIFGLLGGYLTDRLGRRRVLTWSILIYAGGAFFSGFSTGPWTLLFFRCLVFVGVCVEFVAAVAWLAELFPDPRQRERVIGYTQAFSSFGGLLIAFANGLCVDFAPQLPAIQGLFGEVQNPHAPWRYTLMTGLIPALPLIVIRPFLPESPGWLEKKAAGTLRRPSLRALFTPELRRTTIVTTAMFAMSYGAAFGAIQHAPRIIPGLPEVRAEAQAAATAAMQSAADQPEGQRQVLAARESRRVQQAVAAKVTKVQELGGLFGRAVMAAMAVALMMQGALHFRTIFLWAVSVALLLLEILADFRGGFVDHLVRIGLAAVAGAAAAGVVWGLAALLRRTVRPTAGNLIRTFQIPGLVIIGVTFAYAAVTSLAMLKVAMFLAGFFTIAQFSFWGNYLPRAYPLHLRGTGESFAANIGGRLIGTSFAWVTTTLSKTPVPAEAPMKLAYTAAIVGVSVYLVGIVLSFFLPEPPRETPT